MANIITELHLEMSANWYVTKKLNSIGRVGENTVTKLIIEPTEILDNVTYEIEIADASGSKNVAELTIDGTELYLILTANMLTTSGITKMQVRGLFTDGSIKKSNIFELKVNRSISATEHYEEYAVIIFDQLVQDCRDIIEGAESYAVRAETAAVNAEAYSEAASASAQAASASASTASTASTAAVNAAASAESASTSAHTSAETATTAAASASTSASTAQTSAQTAQVASEAATTASETAVNASTTAQTAATSAENSATSASTSANNASASATSAAASASNASNSATSAETSANNAATSETNAASSAASASTSAANANTSATNAANSATSAAASATNAHNSEVNASTSETNASTSAAEAEASAESIAASVSQINENTYRINDLEAIIAGYQEADLPTGAVASVTDGTALLMPSLKVGIEPVQDLHGYDHPWAGGAGKNLFHMGSRVDATISNITYTSDDEYLYLNGTKQGGGYANLSSLSLTLPAGTYYLKAFIISGDTSNTVELYAYDGSANITSSLIGTERTLTLESEKTFWFRVAIWQDGTVLNNYKIGIVVSNTANIDKFYPYSNICPISGWTAANVTRSGKNLWNTDDIASISVGVTAIRNGLFFRKPGQYTVSAQNSGNYLYCRVFNADGTIKETYFIVSLATITNTTFTISDGEYFAVYDALEGTIALSKSRFNSWLCQVELGSTATTYEPYNGQTTYTIEFKDGDNPLTVYGGTLDVTSGELVVDRAFLTNDYLVNTAGYESAGRNCYVLIGVTLKTLGSSVVDSKLIASALKTDSQDKLYSNRDIGIAHWWNTRIAFSTGDSNVTSVSAFREWLASNGSDVCYELETPTTYHLTPTQVRTLVGTNNIWVDTGDVIEGKYYRSPF